MKNNSNNEFFDNKVFWDQRYLENPCLGSGIGSRGNNMLHKRQILMKYLSLNSSSSILDVGCGDYEVLSEIPIDAIYHGIDISNEVIGINKKKYINRKFSAVDFAGIDNVLDYKSDIVLCLEVLIHQHKEGDYKKLLNNVFAASRIGGLVSGYVSNPRVDVQSEIIAWHEPVTETLKMMGAKNITILNYSLESSSLAFVSFCR